MPLPFRIWRVSQDENPRAVSACLLWELICIASFSRNVKSRPRSIQGLRPI